jgi:protein-disulfide isomerase
VAEKSMATESDLRRREPERLTSGGADNKLLIAVLAGSLFGSVGTYAYLSGNYRFVAPDKYDQLVRGALPVADTAVAPRPQAPQETPRQAPERSSEPSAPRQSSQSRGGPATGDYIGGVEKFDLKDSAAQGPENASVTLVEFSDFECSACAHWEPEIKRITEERSGKIRLVYKHAILPDHVNSRNAALAAEAAKKQGKFWEYSAELFKDQKALQREDLVRVAGQLGLDIAKFKADMDAKEAKDVVDRDVREGERSIAGSEKAGVPAFFINGRRADVASPGQLAALLDKAL